MDINRNLRLGKHQKAHLANVCVCPRIDGKISQMSKTEHNFWLDVTIFVALLITTITGFILWLVIPHKLDIVFLGFSRSVWVAAHIYSGVVGLAGIVMHIVRHRGWLEALRRRPLSGMPGKLRACQPRCR